MSFNNKNMGFKKSYDSNEDIGWFFFNELIKENNIFKSDENYSYRIHSKMGNSYSPYDIHIVKFDKNDKFVKSYFIEVKVRFESYPTYMLEKSKVNSFKKIKAELYGDEADFLYLNFTPDGAFFWSLNNLIDDDKVEYDKINCNISSVENKGKRKKSVLFFSKEEGKRFNYIFSMMDYNKKVRDEEEQKKKNKLVSKHSFTELFDKLKKD